MHFGPIRVSGYCAFCQLCHIIRVRQNNGMELSKHLNSVRMSLTKSFELISSAMVMSSVRTSLLWSVEIRKVWRELFYHLEVKTCFLYHSFSYNAHAVSHQRHTRKIVRILEPVMSADKYLSIFSRQMEAIFLYVCALRLSYSTNS